MLGRYILKTSKVVKLLKSIEVDNNAHESKAMV